MGMKPGYKQTEVGVIPEEWEAKYLRDVCWFQEGPGLRNWQFTNSGMKVINVTNLEAGVLNLDRTDRHISIDLFRQMYQHFAVDAGDIVMASSGNSYSKTAVVRKQDLPLVMNTSVIRFKPNSSTVYGFLWSLLTSWIFKNQIDLMITGGAQPNFGPYHLNRVIVPHPPLPEQRAIATALSDVDALISGLDKLIAKKRDIKQTAMQQLLTGKTRLPGFGGEWEEMKLGDVGLFLKGSGVKKDEAKGGNIPCIRYGELYTHHNDYVKQFNSWISSKVASTATLLQYGDLLFAGSGETKKEIGKCVAFINRCDAYAGGDIVILRLSDADPVFMGYYCNTTPIQSQKTSMGQGDAVVHISVSALSSILVVLPSIQEQSAIATVLSDMDAEITALEKRREKTRDLKRGMMQVLLTGRTRLV